MLFKKFKEEGPAPTVYSFEDLKDRPLHPFSTSYMSASPPSLEEGEPETVIAEGVSIKGTLSFPKLLRIDGHFEGELISTGKLIVGPTGVVKAHLHLEEALIEGKVIGDICVEKTLVLRGHAEVHGDITAPLIRVDEGVCIVGNLNVSQCEKESASI